MFWIYGAVFAVVPVFVLDGAKNSKLIILAEHFLREFTTKNLDYGNLFSAVFFLRFPVLIAVIIGAKMIPFRKVCNCIMGFYGYSMMYVLLVLMVQYGIRGLILSLLLWMPHMFLYMFSVYNISGHTNLDWKNLLGLSGIYLLGIILEIYVNPVIIHSVSKVL